MRQQPFDPRLAIADDALFDAHHARGYHPERPERLEAARRGIRRLEASGVPTTNLAPRDASDDAIRLVHSEAWLETLAKLEGHQAQLDADTFLAPKSVAAARRAAGAAIAAVDALFDAGRPAASVALVRPPGHHATPSTGMGFCLLNNAAIAARWAMKDKGLKRVAIVDYDVHHGNGTQDAFYSDPSVLYVSTHQYPLYPGTGAASEVGSGEGKGTTINVPLSAEADDAVYADAFARVVVPVLHAFAPELVIVSAGFDAHAKDPLAAMRLSESGYAHLTRELVKVADATASGRIALLMEGGYDLAAIEASVEAAARALLRGDDDASPPRGEVDPRHAREIEEARKTAARSFKELG